MFRRFFDEGLAQSSYLLGCDRTRRAAVIDPRRDIDEYARIARELDLTITHTIDTHIHADYLSGSPELAALGAGIVSGPGAGLTLPHREAADGERIAIGDIELTCLHTPGHTPEHLSLVSRHPGEPVRAFTGDTLFVGAVGRPDLLGQAATRGLAGRLHQSLVAKLMTLPDDVEVWPGHGAGSLCGSGIGHAASSTIGVERCTNRLLQYANRDEFVQAVLADLPDTPPYFPRTKRLNQRGAPVLRLADGIAAPSSLTADEAAVAMSSGAWMLDLRSATDHGLGHPARSVSIGFGPKVGYWAAWVVPEGARIVLMDDGEGAHAAAVRRQLIRVGLDDVAGWVEGGYGAWRTAGLPERTIAQLPAGELGDSALDSRGIAIIDVRSRREWESGHVPGARHVPLHELAARLDEIPRDRSVAAICEGGNRSSLAASLLEREGITKVLNITGGMAAWRALGARSS